MKLIFYELFEDMFDDLDRKMKLADSKVTELQKRYCPGDIVIQKPGIGFPVFHDILDIEKVVKDMLWQHGDDYENEGIYTLNLYREHDKLLFCTFIQ